MFIGKQRQRTRLVVAAAVMACFGVNSGAKAAHHHKPHAYHAAKAAKAKPVPAHLKPTYVGAQGYPGGAPGPKEPALIDIGAPQPIGPLFKGLPVLDQLGL